jgi:hypothetical protein
MPEIIACPDCGRKLRVPDDLLGRKVKCPGCGVNFTASVVGGGAPPPVPQIVGAPRAERRGDDDRPRRRDDDEPYEDDRVDVSRSSPRQAWKRVRLGLNFVIISIWVFLGTIGVWIIGSLFLFGFALDALQNLSSGALEAAGAGAVVLGLFVQLAYMAHLGLRVTGFGMGMAVPPKRNSAVRGLAIASFIVGASQAGLVLVIVIIIMATNAADLAGAFGFGELSRSGGTGALMLLEFLVWAASAILFLFYLRSLCLVVRKDGLASTITTFMISVGGVGLVMFLIWIFIIGVASMGVRSGHVSPSGGGGFAIIGCGLLGLGFAACIALFVWYIVILHQVKGAVISYIRKL